MAAAAALVTAGTGGKPTVDLRLRTTPRRLSGATPRRPGEGNSARKQHGGPGNLTANSEQGGLEALGGFPMTSHAASRRAEFEVLPFAQEWVLRACRIATGPSHQSSNVEVSATTPLAVPSLPPPASAAGSGGGGGSGELFLGYGCFFGDNCNTRMTAVHREAQAQPQPPLCCRLEPTRIEPDLVPQTSAICPLESPGGYQPTPMEITPKEIIAAEVDRGQCEPIASVDATAQWPAIYFPFLNMQSTSQQ
jgi:hypothetical protein